MTDFENSDAPIDFERLREVTGDDAELTSEILEMYFSQTRELLGELKRAVGAKDADAVYKSAHKALGSSLTCGMNHVAPPLRELEQAGRSGSFEDAEQLLAQAEEFFVKTESYLESNRGKLSN